MKIAIIFFYLIFPAMLAYPQASDLSRYYPGDSLFKNLHVKSVLDTFESPALHHVQREYDRSGRQISWCYLEDSVVTRFRYVKSGDTLIRYHYYTKGGIMHDVYRFEFFIYNKKGRISAYQSCSTNYNGHTCNCSMDKFFYAGDGRLTTKLSYENRNYKQPFSAYLSIDEHLLGIIDGYSYLYNKDGKLILVQQQGNSAMRSTDSLFYNNAGKLIKVVSRQSRGYLGEIAVNNLCHFKTLAYRKNKRIETKWVTYSTPSAGDMITADPIEDEYVYYPNGLQQIWFRKTDHYPKSMLSYLVYSFNNQNENN